MSEQATVDLIVAFAPYVFVLATGFIFRDAIRNRILPNVTSIEGFGLKIGLVSKRLDEAVEARRSGSTLVVPAGQADRLCVLRRARRLASLLQGARLLWIDPDPGGNHSEIELVRSLGIGIDLARSGQEAAELLKAVRYDVVLSNIKRVDIVDGNTFPNGIKFLKAQRAELMRQGRELPPVAFYVMDVCPKIDTSLALGVTNRPDRLLHYVFDGIERTRS